MLYPSVVKQFKVYGPDGFIIGTADITLPKLTWEKDTLKGAGLGGSFNLPVMGNVTAMECTINFHTPTDQILGLFQGNALQIRCMASVEFVDTSTGEFDEKPEEVIMTVFPSEYDSNKREPSVKGTVSMRFDCTYLAIYFGGKAYFQIDPFNDVCVLNGTDVNQKTRANVG
jgi:P2 family phage contractile tail tube protein